jgi:hypothetical protein
MGTQKTEPLTTSLWQPAGPLWQRAPSKQTDGAPLADLMMLIPDLKHYSELRFSHVKSLLESVLREFGDKVVFTDINLKLNVVWVTVLPEPGLCREVALAIRERIPEAVMVGNQIKLTTSELQSGGWQGWIRYMRGLFLRQLDGALPHVGAKGRSVTDERRLAD